MFQHNTIWSDLLQNVCIDYLKNSEISADYALTVDPLYIAREIYICEVHAFPVIFIHTRCTIIEGNSVQRAVS